MADNNLARSRNDFPDFFAEDDPLAELARIVGYEDRPTPKPVAPAPQREQRHEPAFNLEDELLLEFERYDAPRLDPVHDISFDEAPAAATFEPQPQRFVPAADMFDPHSAPRAEEPAAENDFGFDARPTAAHEVAVPVASQPMSDDEPREPAFELATLPVAGPVSPVQAFVEPTEAFDLAAELESSFTSVDEPVRVAEPAQAAVPAPVAQPAPLAMPTPEPVSAFSVEPEMKPEPAVKEAAKGYVPGFRMPLANFNKAAAPAVAKAAEPVFDLPVLDDFPKPAKAAPVDRSWSFETPAAPAVNVKPAPSAAPQSSATQSAIAVDKAAADGAKDRFSSLDDLIYDVQRYSLPAGASATPVVKQQEPVVAPAPVSAQLAPQVIAPVAAAVAAPAAASSAVVEKDPFADEEFELALDDLELDLADLVLEEVQKPAPVVAAPAPAPVAFAPAAAVAPAPVAAAPIIASAPIAVPGPVAAPAMAAMPAADEDTLGDLPFDPAEIADAEEHVEAIADLDVPALPVEEPEQKPAYRPEYEFDIDAELATLLVNSGKAEPSAPSRGPAIDIAASRGMQAHASHAHVSSDMAPQAMQGTGHAELDDFERALEEDFRKSLAAPLPAGEHEELQYGDADYLATVENARRSVRSWAVPLVIAGVVVLGGVGAYAWISGKGVPGVSGNGQPVIIAADNGPVKVAPQNPGGKTVPNQDKAVYDRVAGGAAQDPKQRQLISSSEQPVDVVQKTLMPDTLPLEGENDIPPTDVGETQDPRLLPDQGQMASLAADQQPVTVMPRKVKTMIVRPDGKLVEQDAPAPALAAPSQAKVQGEGTKAVDVAAASARPQPAAAQGNGAAAVVPASVPVSGGAAAKTGAIAPVSMPVSQPAPAPVQPVAASAKAPVPAARPAEQPVNVVAAVSDQGNVRASAKPAASQAAAAPTQVASLGDGGYVIQIASLPSQAEAQKSYQSLSSKFGGVIGGRGVDIKSADIAGKGTFYRVRIPAGSKTDAVALCEKYRAAGGTCLVAK